MQDNLPPASNQLVSKSRLKKLRINSQVEGGPTTILANLLEFFTAAQSLSPSTAIPRREGLIISTVGDSTPLTNPTFQYAQVRPTPNQDGTPKQEERGQIYPADLAQLLEDTKNYLLLPELVRQYQISEDSFSELSNELLNKLVPDQEEFRDSYLDEFKLGVEEFQLLKKQLQQMVGVLEAISATSPQDSAADDLVVKEWWGKIAPLLPEQMVDGWEKIRVACLAAQNIEVQDNQVAVDGRSYSFGSLRDHLFNPFFEKCWEDYQRNQSLSKDVVKLKNLLRDPEYRKKHQSELQKLEDTIAKLSQYTRSNGQLFVQDSITLSSTDSSRKSQDDDQRLDLMIEFFEGLVAHSRSSHKPKPPLIDTSEFDDGDGGPEQEPDTLVEKKLIDVSNPQELYQLIVSQLAIDLVEEIKRGEFGFQDFIEKRELANLQTQFESLLAEDLKIETIEAVLVSENLPSQIEDKTLPFFLNSEESVFEIDQEIFDQWYKEWRGQIWPQLINKNLETDSYSPLSPSGLILLFNQTLIQLDQVQPEKTISDLGIEVQEKSLVGIDDALRKIHQEKASQESLADFLQSFESTADQGGFFWNSKETQVFERRLESLLLIYLQNHGLDIRSLEEIPAELRNAFRADIRTYLAGLPAEKRLRLFDPASALLLASDFNRHLLLGQINSCAKAQAHIAGELKGQHQKVLESFKKAGIELDSADGMEVKRRLRALLITHGYNPDDPSFLAGISSVGQLELILGIDLPGKITDEDLKRIIRQLQKLLNIEYRAEYLRRELFYQKQILPGMEGDKSIAASNSEVYQYLIGKITDHSLVGRDEDGNINPLLSEASKTDSATLLKQSHLARRHAQILSGVGLLIEDSAFNEPASQPDFLRNGKVAYLNNLRKQLRLPSSFSDEEILALAAIQPDFEYFNPYLADVDLSWLTEESPTINKDLVLTARLMQSSQVDAVDPTQHKTPLDLLRNDVYQDDFSSQKTSWRSRRQVGQRLNKKIDSLRSLAKRLGRPKLKEAADARKKAKAALKMLKMALAGAKAALVALWNVVATAATVAWGGLVAMGTAIGAFAGPVGIVVGGLTGLGLGYLVVKNPLGALQFLYKGYNFVTGIPNSVAGFFGNLASGIQGVFTAAAPSTTMLVVATGVVVGTTIYMDSVQSGAFLFPTLTTDGDRAIESPYVDITKETSLGRNWRVDNGFNQDLEYQVTIQPKLPYDLNVAEIQDILVLSISLEDNPQAQAIIDHYKNNGFTDNRQEIVDQLGGEELIKSGSIAGVGGDTTVSLYKLRTKESFDIGADDIITVAYTNPIQIRYSEEFDFPLTDTNISNTFAIRFAYHNSYTGEVGDATAFSSQTICVGECPQSRGLGCWPVSGIFNQHPFSVGTHKNSDSIDISAPAGTPIYTPFDGEILDWIVFPAGGEFGIHVVLESDFGTYAFAHMSAKVVEAPTSVRAGDLLGYVGTTGYSFGNHLHFERAVFVPSGSSMGIANPTHPNQPGQWMFYRANPSLGSNLLPQMPDGESVRVGDAIRSCYD